MPYFKVIVKMGHMGKGKCCEIPLYIEANDAVEAMKVRGIGGIQHNAIPVSVKPIDEEEYNNGLIENKYYKHMDALRGKGKYNRKKYSGPSYAHLKNITYTNDGVTIKWKKS